MKFKPTKRIIGIAIIIVAVSIAIFLYISNKNKSKESSQATVQTIEVRTGNVQATVSASGQVQSSNYLPITTSVNGIVKKVYVSEGDSVKEGQKIMEITLDEEGEKALLSAQSSYLKAKSSLESAKNSLYTLESALITKTEEFDTEKEQNSYQSSDERQSYKLAENDYLKAKADLDIKKGDISQAQIALSSSYKEYQAQLPTIYAPDTGKIANLVYVEGTKIENSVSERSVVTIASIKIEGNPIVSVNVTEIDINSIEIGQKAIVTLSSINGEAFNGTVVGMDKIGTVNSGVANYPVTIRLETDDSRILPNMSIQAKIITAKKQGVLTLPVAAINTDRNVKYVNAIVNGKTQRIEVETGVTGDSFIEIVSGLSEGQQVQVSGLPKSGFSSDSLQMNGARLPGMSGSFNRR